MGWLPFIETEDEMAAILTHELSHVLLTHHSSDLLLGFHKRAQSVHELGIGAKMAVQKTQASKTDQQVLLGSQLLTDASSTPRSGGRTRPPPRSAKPIASCRPRSACCAS